MCLGIIETEELQERIVAFCATWRERWDGSNYRGYFESGGFGSGDTVLTDTDREYVAVKNVVEADTLAFEDLHEMVHEIQSNGDIDTYQVYFPAGYKPAQGDSHDQVWAALFGKEGERVKDVAIKYRDNIEFSDYFPVGNIKDAVQDVYERVADWYCWGA